MPSCSCLKRVLLHLPVVAVLGWDVWAAAAPADEWPTLHHDLQRTGRSADCVRPPFHVLWVRAFDGEIIATRCEAISAGGRVYVGTYAGRLHCLEAETGREAWSRELGGAILHSPCVHRGVVFSASLAGLWAMDARSGELRWHSKSPEGGYCTSPAVTDECVLIGGRDGVFRACGIEDGALKWQVPTGGPIRTTAAVRGSRVFFASDDMRAYAVDIRSGRLVWTSEQLYGQSLRDYYPVVAGRHVVLRTNPAIRFSDRIAQDCQALSEAAGLEDCGWKGVEEYLQSERVVCSEDRIAREQEAIVRHMARDPQARTFYLLDADTGTESVVAPVLWVGGCGGVGCPPIVMADGLMVVYDRSACTNFTLGVAPFVGLGYLSSDTGRIQRIYHVEGRQPPWNTFWGTADECQSFSLGGDVLYITHQGTLGGLDLKTQRLFAIAGNRDTWGGLPSLPWTRNEWHGPARGAVAIAGETLYWITGSRVIAVRGVRQ